jgi:hypothetical protein
VSMLADAVQEIEEFVSSYKVDSVFAHKGGVQKYRTAYKSLHAILIWSTILDDKRLPDNKYGPHAAEMVADLSHAFVLITLSLYKPCRMMLRSSIENLTRVALANRGEDFSIRSVHVLFENALTGLDKTSDSHKLISEAKSLYADLCKTVHSAQDAHLSKKIPFERIVAYDEASYSFTINYVTKTSSVVNKLLFVLFFKELERLKHKSRDFILDSLPKRLKERVFSDA